ncbi:MAG: hypothetical protein LBJ63_00420 [Prevotellaceae bacterium]|jgi:hypothetical protein|nr:hypothetical protein [Prevotellaceae bacterium]
MNKKQKIVMGIIIILFSVLCLIIPVQKYYDYGGRKSPIKTLPYADAEYAKQFLLVQKEYDFGWLVTRSLVLFACGTFVLLVLKNKKQDKPETKETSDNINQAEKPKAPNQENHIKMLGYMKALNDFNKQNKN